MNGKTTQHRFNYVLFDLGNTLYYFQGVWLAVLKEGYLAVTRALAEMGYVDDIPLFAQRFSQQMEAYYREREVTCIEQTSLAILRRTLNEFHQGPVPLVALRRAIDALYSVSESYWYIEEDTEIMLETLRRQGYRLGVISNAADACDVNTLIDRANLRDYFDQVVISAEFGLRKPHPKIFSKALSYWQARPEESIMIGDTLPADIWGAQQMKIPAVWITRRVDKVTCRKDYPAIEPDACINTLAELPELLSNWV
jgi:HAD superfamily hydrolase (TIGR01549 family)